MAETRIYHVKLHGKSHLVEAATKSAAARHVLSSHGTVEVASQRDLVTLTASGVTIETAGNQPE